jgi:hypothetical protein
MYHLSVCLGGLNLSEIGQLIRGPEFETKYESEIVKTQQGNFGLRRSRKILDNLSNYKL